jgi:catechol 2,3-dioxygenase-like lactoylglutathione lyase family enzyme
MRKLFVIIGLLAVLSWQTPARAQIVGPNIMGVSMGHINLNAKDAAAADKFWIALGGTAGSHGPLKFVKFPGALVVTRQAEPSAPAAGSIVDHVGFYVRNLRQSIETWKAAGVKTDGCSATPPCQITTPDGLVRIDIMERPSLAVPMAFGYVYFRVFDAGGSGRTAMADMQAWYAKVFGATPGREGNLDSASLPGGTLLFAKADAPTAPTVGRAINHIGFEVANLEEFYKRAEANGVKFERAFIRRPEMQEDLTSLIDPWGTRVELNDGVARW